MTYLTSRWRIDEVSLVVCCILQFIKMATIALFNILFEAFFLCLFLFSDISPSAPSDHLSLVTVLTHPAPTSSLQGTI